MTPRHLLRITIAAALWAPLAAALADAPAAPDTSNWACESCPFAQSYDADAAVGALHADGANASYGRYSGIDRQKTYADVEAHGSWRGADGAYASYALDDLGLDSRSGQVRLGRAGRFDVGLSYDGQPYRRYDATVTPYSGGATQTLPAGWVAAGTTAGMTALAASLHDVDIGTLRKSYGLDGRWRLGGGFGLYGSVQRQDKTGTQLLGASFLTQALQLAAPVDYQTDTVEVGATWANRTTNWRLAFSNSKFKNSDAALVYANPYLPLVPGVVDGRLARAPDNEARQWSLGGSIALPLQSTVSVSLGYSELRQDAALLPASTLPGAVPPATGFDGDVKIAHYAATLGSRPAARLNLHGRVAYDDRRDHSTVLSIAQVVTDAAPGATVTTPRYDFERIRLDGGADYRLWRWLTVGIGGDRVEINRTQQVVHHTEDGRTYGRVRLTPWSSLALTLKGGFAHREARGIDLTLLPLNENPALSIYNLSNRDRDYFELETTWNPTETLSVALQGTLANDVYRRSTFGLLEGRERRLNGTVGWTPAEKLSFYADAGYQNRRTLQAGRFSSATAPWQAELRDRYWNAGAGGHWTRGRWDLSADYSHATSAGATGVGAAGLLGAYPDLRSRYDSARLGVGYALTDALRLRLRYLYQDYATVDWALDEVGPSTAANLLALGAPADAHNVNVIALSLSYRFGTPAPAPKTDKTE